VETLFASSPSELAAIVGASAEGLPALRRRLARRTNGLVDRGARSTRETGDEDDD